MVLFLQIAGILILVLVILYFLNNLGDITGPLGKITSPVFGLVGTVASPVFGLAGDGIGVVGDTIGGVLSF
jgi:hypothetical protein